MLVVDDVEFDKCFHTAAESPYPYVPIAMRTKHTECDSDHAARGLGVPEAPAKSLYLRLFNPLGNSRPIVGARDSFELTGVDGYVPFLTPPSSAFDLDRRRLPCDAPANGASTRPAPGRGRSRYGFFRSATLGRNLLGRGPFGRRLLGRGFFGSRPLRWRYSGPGPFHRGIFCRRLPRRRFSRRSLSPCD